MCTVTVMYPFHLYRIVVVHLRVYQLWAGIAIIQVQRWVFGKGVEEPPYDRARLVLCGRLLKTFEMEVLAGIFKIWIWFADANIKIGGLLDWLTDWLTAWLTDWQTAWLTDWKQKRLDWTLRESSRSLVYRMLTSKLQYIHTVRLRVDFT